MLCVYVGGGDRGRFFPSVDDKNVALLSIDLASVSEFQPSFNKSHILCKP